MKDYLLLMRGGKPLSAKTEEETKAEWAAWGVYMAKLTENGSLTGGFPLVSGGKSVSAEGMTNEPITSSPEGIVGGYLIIKADSLDDAAALVKDCPHLLYKGNIEIREIAPMPEI